MNLLMLQILTVSINLLSLLNTWASEQEPITRKFKKWDVNFRQNQQYGQLF